MQCCSMKAGHNLDPAEAIRRRASSEPKPGYLRVLRHNPLIIWFDGSHSGYGYDGLYWSHDTEAIFRTANERLSAFSDQAQPADVPPLDPGVWVPTIATKVMAETTAPNFTNCVRVHIWDDELMAMDGSDDPALFSIARLDDASTCDRTDRLCPRCGRGVVKKYVMGYPPSWLVGDPNYVLGGCTADGRRSSGDLVCVSCGHDWSGEDPDRK